MRVCSISWNGNSDVTKIKYSDEFATSDWIVKADVLKDCILMMSNLHNQVLKEEAKAWHKEVQMQMKKTKIKAKESKNG